MQSTKALLLGVIAQGPRPYGNTAPPIVPSIAVTANCALSVDVSILSDSSSFADGVFWAGMTGSIVLRITNESTDPISSPMPLAPAGLTLPYNWSSNFLILAPGAYTTVTAEYVVTGSVGSEVVLDFSWA